MEKSTLGLILTCLVFAGCTCSGEIKPPLPAQFVAPAAPAVLVTPLQPMQQGK